MEVKYNYLAFFFFFFFFFFCSQWLCVHVCVYSVSVFLSYFGIRAKLPEPNTCMCVGNASMYVATVCFVDEIQLQLTVS